MRADACFCGPPRNFLARAPPTRSPVPLTRSREVARLPRVVRACLGRVMGRAMASTRPSASTVVVLFTRDLRVRDHPALAQAAAVAERVVPLFVLDEALLDSGFASANRLKFLLESLRDLDESLRALGGALVIRRGDPVREVLAVARAVRARAVFATADVSGYARRRERRLTAACTEAGLELGLFPGVTVVDAGEIAPASGDYFRVFTPYWNRWRAS